MLGVRSSIVASWVSTAGTSISAASRPAVAVSEFGRDFGTSFVRQIIWTSDDGELRIGVGLLAEGRPGTGSASITVTEIAGSGVGLAVLPPPFPPVPTPDTGGDA